MQDTKLRMCAPINTPSGLNRPHNITRNDGFKFKSDGSKRRTHPRNELQEHMFDAYIEGISIDTYDFIFVNIDQSVYNPVREYLWNIPTGMLGASLIGQTSNPHIVQKIQNCSKMMNINKFFS